MNGSDRIRKRFCQRRQGSDMIEVAVGQQYVLRAEVIFFQIIYNKGAFGAGINYGAELRCSVNPAVCFKAPDRKAVNRPVFWLNAG